ncbi:MAG: hypothetical protein ACXVIH_14070, partial [Ilumatobacteraceae bacterium]
MGANGESAQHLPEGSDLTEHHQCERRPHEPSLRDPRHAELRPAVEHRQEDHPDEGRERVPALVVEA